MASPASTQVVAETPLAQLLAHQQDHFASSWDGDTQQAHSIRGASREAPSVLAPEGDTDSVHFATHADPATEIQLLRQSRVQIVETLGQSTDHVNRLQARLLVYAGEKTALTAELGQARLDREKALGGRERAAGAGGVVSTVLRDVMGFVLVVVGLYLFWLWVNQPEFLYIRKRRAQILCD